MPDKSQMLKPKSQPAKLKTKKFWSLVIIWNLVLGVWNLTYLYSEEKKPEPIIVNGDTVEYSADSKEVTAVGNVEVIYKGAKLTCQKLTVNTQTKEGVAEGNARLEEPKGIIEGSKIIYNFETKIGTMVDSEFRANPYFGKAKQVEKVKDTEFIARNGYATTCSLDQPHYRIGSRQINMFPQDKIQTKGDTFYLGKIPVLYLSEYNHSLKDPLMHVQVTPGKSKDWGPYVLSAWRYNLTEHINGRLYLDLRTKLGTAEGFGENYDTGNFGKGDLKFYYTKERPERLDPTTIPNGAPTRYGRYLLRWRHKWDIDTQTNLTSEFYKIADARRKFLDSQRNFLKDYFFREYEKDSQPLSYALLHRNFTHSSLDFLMQKRVNHWFNQLDKLPEVKYTFPNLEIGESPFYFENISSFANFNKKATTLIPTSNEVSMTRLDTSNKFSLPMKVAFFRVTPFVANQETVYDKGADGASLPIRTIFSSGADLSTKFYRTFKVKSNFLGMDLNGLRHIITPTVGYAYNHTPTIPATNLKQIDGIDALAVNNSASLGLTNKLQTKRSGQSVDLVDFNVTSTYLFKPKTGAKKGSNLSDFLFKLQLLPYSWLRINTDATYKHSGSRSNTNYNTFTNASYDINLDFGKDRSFGVGQRYLRKGGNAITYSLDWRINPKWKFSAYNRYERGHDLTLKRGLREQQYVISRDLHCWTMDLAYNVRRDSGDTIWIVFRLKAFPELEFGLNQSYHQPKPGSQSNPSKPGSQSNP